MRLEPVSNTGVRDRLLRGDCDPYDVAPGWPHEDSAAGMSFLDYGGLVFVVIDDDERIAGECGTKGPTDVYGGVEIGYGLAAPSRGRGLGTAAVTALVGVVAADPSVRQIEAEVHLSNEASWRILTRLGFVPAGPVKQGFGRYLLKLGR